jgi:diguanylate cyclase (GGDEF)-like protein
LVGETLQGSTHLSLSLLGSFQCYVNGEDRSSSFRTKKERLLLAYLVVEADRPHQREVLGEMFWPGKPEGYARMNLRQALSGIRRAIQVGDVQTPFLSVSDEYVQLNAQGNISLDCKLFDTLFEDTLSHSHQNIETCPACVSGLDELIDLYRGEFLDESLLPNTYIFQEWVLFKREHYFRRLLTSLNVLVKHYQNAGEIKIALDYANRQASLAPLEESAHRQLMTLLALDGRRSAAMEQYQTCCRILLDELDVTPDLETTALYEKIKAGLIFNTHRPVIRPSGTNLPVQFTKFVGRERELDWILEKIQAPDSRLLTITGISGVGKSRLAVQAGARLLHIFDDGVWFVPLNAIHAADLIPQEVVRALRIDPGDADPRRAVIDSLRTQNAILIIDNFEHLIEGTTFLLDILKEAPGIKVIVTSQRRLSYQAAHVLELKGLPYPEEDDSHWEGFDAVELFISRAKRNQPDFKVTNKDVPDLIRICKAVDGLPLGLELAAAGLRFYACNYIAQELQNNLDILKTTLIDIPERHRSLRAAFNQSWSMLSDLEKDAYRRLSVFQGEFSIDEAVATTGASLVVITSLVDRSLIQRNSTGYYLIQPILRQYAAEKLEEIYDLDQRDLSFYSNDGVSITRDPMTLLPNKVLFRDLFKQALATARRRRQYLALLVIETNGMNPIRSQLDSKEVNAIIKKVANILTQSVRDCDIVSHLVPGKFAIILENISHMQDGALVTQKIRSNFDSANLVSSNGDKISLSIGISVYPHDSEDIAELLNCANIALNEARLEGQNFKYFAYETPILFSVKT